MYGLISRIKSQPGQRGALLDLLLRAAESLGDVEGCYIYLISEATDDPDTVWITEAWRSKADHDASLTNEAVRAIIASARPLIADTSGGFEIVPVGGRGLPPT